MTPRVFSPVLAGMVSGYSFEKLRADLVAGITLGVIALPLAMAFGIASGVNPQQGIYTGIVAGFLVAMLGGTRLCIAGPTGAFVVIVYRIVQEHGIEKLAVCTVLAGLLLVAMGLFRAGALIKFIPYPVTTGFTSGIAVIILLAQVRDFLGLPIDHMPAAFFEKVPVLLAALPRGNWVSLGLAGISLGALLVWPRIRWLRVPGPIVILLAASAAVAVFHLPVETIGSRFGGIPQGFPEFRLPAFGFATIAEMLQPSITIALLCAIESLLCAVVADGMTGDRHDPNTELIAQGIGNIASPLFGGIPATGAIARTAANIQAGAVSPVSGMVHAGTLLAIILAAAPLAKHVPLAALSAILVGVALRMGEWREFLRLPRLPRSDAAVFLVTFLLTVVFDLTIAVQLGMLLAAMLFIRRVAETTAVDLVTGGEDEEGGPNGTEIPGGVAVYRIAGPLLFGAADKLERALAGATPRPRVIILRMRAVTSMDATALNALEMLVSKIRSRGGHVIVCGAHTQPYFVMSQAGFLEELGEDHVVGSWDEALSAARRLMEPTTALTNPR